MTKVTPVTKKSRSPYQKYGKQPYKYPDWARATSKGGHTPKHILAECFSRGGDRYDRHAA